MKKREYEATVISVSKEISAKEKIQLKDTSDAVKLDKSTQCESVIIDVDYYGVISVHNAAAENPDYEVYVVVDKDGTRYVTGSESFYSALEGIMSDMQDVNEEWQLKVYRRPSTKREGKEFITCSIV